MRKWNLGSYNGKIKLPNDIFRPLPSAEIQREIAAKEYLTNEMLTIVDGHKSKPKALPKVSKCFNFLQKFLLMH